MDKKKSGFRGGLLGEYILYGIFVGIAIFLVIKYFGGWNVTVMKETVAVAFLVSVIAGIIVAGLFSYFLSQRSLKNFSIDIVMGMVRFLQQKSILPLEYKEENLKDSKAAKNKIFNLLGIVADRIAELNKAKKEYEDTVARYTDMKGMSTLQLNNTKGEIKDVSIVFTDIKNFDQFYQSVSTEEVMRFLNTYISMVTSVVHGQGGIVNKIIGDEVMSVFEAKPGEDKELGHELRALTAAMEIARKFESIVFETKLIFSSPMKVAFGVGIGMHSGPAMVGTIGSKERMEFTVLGDTVEIAGHVAQNADIGVVLMTEDTYHRIGKRAEVIEMAPIRAGYNNKEYKVFIAKGINLIIR